MKYRIDFAFPHAMVAVEAQSYVHHDGRTDWQKDYRKGNVIRALGWRLVNVTWEDLNDPERKTFHIIRRMLFPELFGPN